MRDAILDALCAMLPARFEVVVAKLGIPPAYLSSGSAPQATRAVEVVRALEAEDRLAELAAMLRPAAAGVSMAPRVSIARLPVTGKDLFGRESELAWLDQCWGEGAHVATIVAWGGVGKSALVNAWLARLRDAGWAGAERVFAWSFYKQGTGELTSSDEFIDAALRWFGDADPTAGSPWDKGERLADLVRKERVLLILDGVEPLQRCPGVEQGKLKDPALQVLVKELGAQNKGLCLITTRIEVTDLEAWGGDKVQTHRLDHLSTEAGAQLLKARGAKGPEEELHAAAKEYDGHGLALTLLGSYVRKRYKGDIYLRAHIPLLEGEPARRMMGSYERWFARKPEIVVLCLLGLFDRPASADEIAVLRAKPPIPGLTMFLKGLKAGAWNDAVTTLKDVGLLAPGSAGDESLDAHPLVREYFAELLRREHPEAWREGHRRLYEHLKRKAKPLPETMEEMAPLYAAVIHGSLAGKHQEALKEVFYSRIYRGEEKFNWKQLGAFDSQAGVLSAFFEPPWEQLVPGLDAVLQGWVLNEAGFTLRALGRLPEAAELMRIALEKGLAQKNWKAAAIRSSTLSEILQARGELSEALAQARISVMLADESREAIERKDNRATLAAAQHAMGLREDAAAQLKEAERIQKEMQPGYPLLYSLAGFIYCDFLLDQGRVADVQERATQTLEWAKRHLASPDLALDHLSLGRAHLLAAQRDAGRDLASARSHLEDAVKGLRRSGYQTHLPVALFARATLRTHTRAFADARHDLEEALSIATRCGFRLHETDAHLGHARLSLAEGNPTAAHSHLATARKLIHDTGYHRRDEELAELEALAP